MMSNRERSTLGKEQTAAIGQERTFKVLSHIPEIFTFATIGNTTDTYDKGIATQGTRVEVLTPLIFAAVFLITKFLH